MKKSQEEALLKLIESYKKVFGGPGSGPQGGGGGGSDGGDDSPGKIAKIPKHERTPAQVKVMLTPMNNGELKGIISKSGATMKNPNISHNERVGATRENTVAQNILTERAKAKKNK